MGPNSGFQELGCCPFEGSVAFAQEIPLRTGARITIHDDVTEAVAGGGFGAHRRVGFDGEVQGLRSERVGLLAPYQVNRALLDKSGNSKVKFMHCLPAFHDPNTVVGREMMEHTGMSEGLEVTGEVFESPASIVFDQAENRLHTIKALLVATLGS